MATEDPISNQNYHYNNNVDKEKYAEKMRLDISIPITTKWWFSAFHNVTVIVGAGVLSLPSAMSGLGWGPGVTFLVISWIITLYTLWQMVEMHEIAPGNRFNRYHELGQYALGDTLGFWIVVPHQLLGEVGVDIVYLITGGQLLNRVHDLVCHDCKDIKLTSFILIFASVQFALCQLPELNLISFFSVVAAVMSVSYSTIAWGASISKGVQPDVQYGYKSVTTPGNVFNFFSALGNIAFSYAGHNVVLEIQSKMPSTVEKPSKGPMWKGVIVAYIVVALCYFPVALIGYWVFGNDVEDNILITLERPIWLIVMASFFVLVHLVGIREIYSVPVFEMMDTVLVKKLKFRPTWYLRFISRSAYFAFITFVAITLPFFGGFLGFIGGLAIAPTTYILPCIIWLAIHKPRRFSLSWFANWVCIIFGVILMIVGPIGGIREIIVDSRN